MNNDFTPDKLDRLLSQWAQADAAGTRSADQMAHKAMRSPTVSVARSRIVAARRWGTWLLAGGGLAATAAAVLVWQPGPADVVQPVAVAQEFPSDSKVFTMLFSVTPDEEDYI